MMNEHTCHWPGCEKLVPPALWGCSAHWFTLPKPKRDELWKHYRRGQEVRKDPTPEYLAAATEIQRWIGEFQASQRGQGHRPVPRRARSNRVKSTIRP